MSVFKNNVRCDSATWDKRQAAPRGGGASSHPTSRVGGQHHPGLATTRDLRCHCGVPIQLPLGKTSQSDAMATSEGLALDCEIANTMSRALPWGSAARSGDLASLQGSVIISHTELPAIRTELHVWVLEHRTLPFLNNVCRCELRMCFVCISAWPVQYI